MVLANGCDERQLFFCETTRFGLDLNGQEPSGQAHAEEVAEALGQAAIKPTAIRELPLHDVGAEQHAQARNGYANVVLKGVSGVIAPCRERLYPLSMNTDGLVFRSVYIDTDVDQTLHAAAVAEGVSKARMYLRYLARGLALADAGAHRPDLADGVPICMRSAYLPVALDETLRVQAYKLRTTQMALMRQYTRMAAEPGNLIARD